jgi:DNA-binding response OmpR family regulator
MIVEDEVSIQRLIKKILEFYSFEVKEYDNAETALEDLENVSPCVILSDIGLPGMDGFEFYSAIVKKMKGREIPVIFITGRTYDVHIKKKLETGKVDFLTKPFDPLTLKEIVERNIKKNDN